MALATRAKIILTIACFGALWFVNLQYRDLFQTDEGRYAEIPREMLASGDWVTPRLDDLKYFEKPPLQYWATAVTYSLFGESNWSSRLWTALTGFLGILMTGFVAARLFGSGAGWGAVLLLASSLYYVIMGHFNTLDMGVTFFMCASLFAFLLAMDAGSERLRRVWMYTAWAAAALATLSKGIEAVVLPGAVFLLYVLITREWGRFKQLHYYGGLLIYLLIAAPWFVLVSLRNPEFPHFFFIHEHFERFLTTVHHRTGPWWFFIPILLLALFAFLPQFIRALIALVRGEARAAGDGRFNHLLFLWLWCGFIFVFFSLSDSKLGSYILPMFPVLAVLVGREFAQAHRGDAVWSSLLCMALAILALWLAPTLREDGGPVSIDLYKAFLPWLAAGCGVLLLLSIAGFFFILFRCVRIGLALLGLGLFLGTQAVTSGAQVLSPVYADHDLAVKIAPFDRPGMPFYSVQDYPQSLPFYLRRTVTVVSYQGELEFGMGQEPQKWIPDMDSFKRRWAADGEALAVMPVDTYTGLAKEGFPMTVIGQNPQHVAVKKP